MDVEFEFAPPWVAAVLSRHPVYDNILSRVSPAALIRLGRTSKLARRATRDFHARAYNVNRHLARFFADPLAFRALQARTATLISGSNALQFFDRSFYPEADLDLYVHPHTGHEVGKWLVEHEGYTFQASSAQSPNFDEAASRTGRFLFSFIEEPLPNPGGGDPATDDFHAAHYNINGVVNVLTFVRPAPNVRAAPEDIRKVQIIVGRSTPLQGILDFHSTCVMNVISWDAAYALYPLATFERRTALAVSRSTGQGDALRKYAQRGFRVLHKPLLMEAHEAPFHLGAERSVNDARSWVLPLDVGGVVPPPPLSISSGPLLSDPVASNSWTLRQQPDRSVLIEYSVVNTTVLKYRYILAAGEHAKTLYEFFREQGTAEHAKVPANKTWTDADVQQYWTWWDSELPAFREAFLRKLNKQGSTSSSR